MAELLLRVVDKINPHCPIKNRLCTKRGDVIHVARDGWPWGSDETANPHWVIVKLPGVDPDDITHLVHPMLTSTNGKPVYKRAHMVNLDKWVGDEITGEVVELDKEKHAQFLAIIERKAVVDTVVIG